MTHHHCIEGIPVIIRFKTIMEKIIFLPTTVRGIEGIPVIIRFKTVLYKSFTAFFFKY